MKQLALIAALLLSACGGSSRHESPPPPAPTPTPPPVSMVDAFFTAVQNLVSSAPDNTEPVGIDSTTATAPENTEPVQVQ
ncbi:MAG: hypothetical protein ACXW2U_07550 [Telluria sp.]